MNEITTFAIKAAIIVGVITLSILILAYYLSPERNCLKEVAEPYIPAEQCEQHSRDFAGCQEEMEDADYVGYVSYCKAKEEQFEHCIYKWRDINTELRKAQENCRKEHSW